MITDLHHVGIAVRDVDKAYALYRDVLRLPLLRDGPASLPGVREGVLAVGGSFIELLVSTEEGSVIERDLEETGEGLHHIALRTDGIDAEVSVLQKRGLLLRAREPVQGVVGRVIYVADTGFDRVRMEIVEPRPPYDGAHPPPGPVRRIDHVVLRVPDVGAVCRRFEERFGVPTKRTLERGGQRFAFLRPGDPIIEVVGPAEPGEPGSGRLAGLALEVFGIDELAAELKAKGYPVGEPHPALQGGRIVSVHHSGACGVPLAFIDFTGSARPTGRGKS
jgi:methylmalonyl-CoA/ethylmalonyl-CoA epimerase